MLIVVTSSACHGKKTEIVKSNFPGDSLSLLVSHSKLKRCNNVQFPRFAYCRTNERKFSRRFQASLNFNCPTHEVQNGFMVLLRSHLKAYFT